MAKANQKYTHLGRAGQRFEKLSKYYNRKHNHFPAGKTGYIPLPAGINLKQEKK